jgi:hypothetical protein
MYLKILVYNQCAVVVAADALSGTMIC